MIREWVVRMATENRSWGYTRIEGALANIDDPVSRGTIANICNSTEPSPLLSASDERRGRSSSEGTKP